MTLFKCVAERNKYGNKETRYIKREDLAIKFLRNNGGGVYLNILHHPMFGIKVDKK